MSRNCGTGTRDMGAAGRILLDIAAKRGELSISSAATEGDRWRQFANFAKEVGVGRIERISRTLVIQFGQELAREAKADEKSVAYAQCLVSAVNTVMGHATKGRWRSVSPTKDCGIGKRCAIREDRPDGYDRIELGRILDEMHSAGLARQACVAALARDFGLRSKEGSLLNCKRAYRDALELGAVFPGEGTKGGKRREVPIVKASQLDALVRAEEVQGDGRNLIPSDASYVNWYNGDLRKGREFLQSLGVAGYHELRSSYACERYVALTGYQAPVFTGRVEDRQADLAARQVISHELGHERVDVVSEYIGGRK